MAAALETGIRSGTAECRAADVEAMKALLASYRSAVVERGLAV
jgi:hypothetical protein